MSEHQHACLQCAPLMRPTVDLEDQRYQGVARVRFQPMAWQAPLIDGVETSGVAEAFGGPDGWARIYQLDEYGEKHLCSCRREPCSTVVHGNVVLRRKVPA